MSSAAVPVPPKKIVSGRNDDSENEEPEENLQEDIELTEDESDESSKQTSDDETGSETNEDASSVEEDEDAGESGEDAGGEGSDDEAAVAVGASATSGSEKEKKNKKRRGLSNKKDAEDDLTLLGVPHGIHFEDDDEEEDDDEDADRDTSEYFQKLTSTMSHSYIEAYHPESMSHNYDEIQTLARVVRNSAGVIVDDLHRTIPIMTKYEKTRVLGQRAKQLNEGAPAFIKIDSTVIDGYLIAVKELEQKKTPFIIRRPLPNGGSEYWRIQDLEIL